MPNPPRTKTKIHRIDERECARQLGVDVQTLVQWATIGYGPRPHRMVMAQGQARRRLMYYSQNAIDEFKVEWQAHRERQELGRFVEC